MLQQLQNLLFYTGGLGFDTEMMSFLLKRDKKGKETYSVRMEDAVLENDKGGLLVSIGVLDDQWYMSRCWPVGKTLRSMSNHCLRLHFSDGSAVLCDRLQKFMLSNHHWKVAKELTPEDSFFQLCRNPTATECFCDYRDDEHGFWLKFTEGVEPIKLTKIETLPETSQHLGIAVDFIRDNVVLRNGLLAEGICLNIKEHDTNWYSE